MEKLTLWIVMVCWLIFIGYWIISASRVKGAAESRSFSSSLAYRLPTLLGGLLIWGLHLPQAMYATVTPRSETADVIAVMACVGGLLIAIWARRTLAGNWSSDVTFKENHELVRTGPYRFVRHPIYTGLLLMVLAPVIQNGRLHAWVGLAVFIVGFWIKLKQEERLMLQHFPDQYPPYCREVKALVPFVV